MSKSKMSAIIILTTIITVTAILNPEFFTAQGFREIKLSALNNINRINFFSKGNSNKETKNQKVTYNDVAQSSEIRVKDVNIGKVDIPVKNSNSNSNSNSEKNSKTIRKGDIILTEAAKKNKLKELHDSQLEDINIYYNDKYGSKDNSKKEPNKEGNKEVNKEISKEDDTKKQIAKDESDKSDTSVFKVSKEQIKDKLTLSDKQKILSVARKLSPSDYEKINKYMANEGDEQGVIDAVKLLRDRLSDNDYEKIKEVAGKFLNMDIVEKK